VASHAALLAYIVGSAAGPRLLRGDKLRRALPGISLVLSLALLRFIGTLLVVSVAIAGLGLVLSGVVSRRRNRASPT